MSTGGDSESGARSTRKSKIKYEQWRKQRQHENMQHQQVFAAVLFFSLHVFMWCCFLPQNLFSLSLRPTQTYMYTHRHINVRYQRRNHFAAAERGCAAKWNRDLSLEFSLAVPHQQTCAIFLHFFLLLSFCLHFYLLADHDYRRASEWGGSLTCVPGMWKLKRKLSIN